MFSVIKQEEYGALSMSGNDIIIESLSGNGFHEWDAYVNQHPSGTFFHLSGWKTVIEKAYGHETNYLIARNGDV